MKLTASYAVDITADSYAWATVLFTER